MKLVSFLADGDQRLGVRLEDGVLDIASTLDSAADHSVPVTMDQLLEQGEAGRTVLRRHVDAVSQDGSHSLLDESDLDLGSPVPSPGKIICVGLNYRNHAEEAGMAFPERPILFNKFSNSLSGHRDTVEIPRDAVQVDFEAELAIVIGTEAKYVDEGSALDHVLGYANGNDLSVREFQFLSSQWMLGKSLDGFCPVGPYLVTSDEIDDPDQLSISCSVNGETRQQSSTADMIFNCAELISFASQYMTLEPGDVILTGTPEGVIMGLPEDEREWLKPDDEVSVEISGLGRLTTIMGERQ